MAQSTIFTKENDRFRQNPKWSLLPTEYFKSRKVETFKNTRRKAPNWRHLAYSLGETTVSAKIQNEHFYLQNISKVAKRKPSKTLGKGPHNGAT